MKLLYRLTITPLAILSLLLCLCGLPGLAQQWVVPGAQTDFYKQDAAGDRIRMKLDSTTELNAASVGIDKDYEIGPGDELSIVVTGKGNLRYHVGKKESSEAAATETASSDSDNIVVQPDGDINLPLVGNVHAGGKNTDNLCSEVKEKLSKYFRNANVSVSVAHPRIMKIWVNGDVVNPGPQVLPGTATVLEAILKAGITNTGSTRNVKLVRNGKEIRVDAYAIVMAGSLSQNLPLQPGDTLFVPAVHESFSIDGEVMRPGSYEHTSFSGGECKVKDAIDLALGFTPAAVPSRATLEHKDASGNVSTTHLDIDKIIKSPDSSENIVLSDGDKLRIPSVGEFQSIIRMVGEFTGDGVYQRSIGEAKEQILNKSGVYKLAQGETAGDVIRKTGGWTPQADLKNARIERHTADGLQNVPLDLDQVLVQKNASKDMVLQNGDTLVLPSIVDKVQILGQVARAGAYPYTPGRKLMDYVGEAGGPLTRAKLSHIRLIRQTASGGKMTTLSAKTGMGESSKNNPILEPGDIVFIPENTINDWRDVIQLFTSYKLVQSLF